MKSLNLNYLRGLYDFLLGKADEELERFDINSSDNQEIVFSEMRRKFLEFGPISRENIVNGVNYIFANSSSDCLWRNAIPHDLPLDCILDRQGYLKGILFALTKAPPSSINVKDFVLIDEIGPHGLDYSK